MQSVFVPQKPSKLSSSLSEYCHFVIVSILSQKDSVDDTQGLASTKKLNCIVFTFERGDSQHENIPINM